MEFHKRDCGIIIETTPRGYDWTYCDIDFGVHKFKFVISGAMADSLDAFMNGLFYLIPINCSFGLQKGLYLPVDAVDVYDKEGYSCRSFPTKAQFAWDGESIGRYVIEIEKIVPIPDDTDDIVDTPDFEVCFKFKEDYQEEWKSQIIVRYDDLCYALAKALTKNLKDFGFQGYYWSQCYEDLNVRELLFIKSVGLRDMRVWDNCKDTDGQDRSNLRDELDLLLFDM